MQPRLSNRHPFREAFGRLSLAMLGVVVGTAAGVEAQVLDRGGVLPDTYADPGARALLERARTARHARAAGLEGFDVTFRERIYAGLGGRIVRRERAVFHQERAARVRWSPGERVVRWLGVRRGVPIVGLGTELEEDPRTDDLFDLEFDFLDPASDRLFMGSDWALHPLADSAVLHYRYRSGDTLRIRLPGAGRTVTLAEIRIEPRAARFDRIVGSFWFDLDEAVLARAAYRPAIEYDFEREEPDDASEVPGFVKPIRAAVDYIVVDYGLQELSWWLPDRMAFDGVGSIGGYASMPIRFEWTFEDWNTRGAGSGPGPPIPGDQPEPPAGWTRWEETHEAGTGTGGAENADPDSVRIVHIVPPADSLLSAPELPDPLFSARVDAFEEARLGELRERLSRIRVPDLAPAAPTLRFGPVPGLVRYNRVEGLSPAVRFSWPTGATTRMELTGRIGIPEWEPGLEVRWARETVESEVGLGAYRRLTDLGDWGRPLGFGNSVNTLLTGYDDGLYYRQTGFEAFASGTGARSRWEARLFAERQQRAWKTTDVTLPGAWSDRTLPPNLSADRAELAGAGGRVRLFSGVDPRLPIVSGTLWGEVAAGDFDYGRGATSLGVHVPLPARWSAALEVGAGTVVGDPPVQRLFHLGGPYTLRAFEPGAVFGESFWLARAEIGRAFAVGGAPDAWGGGVIRFTGFVDAAWAGPRSGFGLAEWSGSVGAGVSLLDGLLRFDLARAVRGGSDWRLHVYTDGLM